MQEIYRYPSQAQNDPGLSGIDLRYRRQFAATFQPSDKFSHWQHYEFAEEGLHIYAHPDLEMTSTSDESRNVELVLLGYAIDPYYPDRSNKDIINAIINAEISSIEDLSAAVCNLAGRFVLIAAFSSQIYVFHDACGLRSVFYAQVSGNTYLASQPLLFSEFFALKASDRYHAFNESSYKRDRINSGLPFVLPCGIGLYEDTYQLVPNHYLDMRKVVQKRYWPNQPIAKQRIEEASQWSADMLAKLISAANARYKLALSLSAGWDSRLLLAASKSVADGMLVYTHILRHMTEQHPDVMIPQSIFGSYKELDYQILDCRSELDPEFHRLYNANVDFADQRTVQLALEILRKIPQDRVAMKGSCAEIVRCAYYPYGISDKIVSSSQFVYAGWEELPFIAERLEEWFKGARRACDNANMELWDLFYWEHDMGSWMSQVWLEKDIAQESFSPFNYRPLMTMMLGVPVKYRREPDYLLFQRMIKRLWPELLNWPINPKPMNLKGKIEMRLRQLLLNLGLYALVRRLYKSIKN